MADNQNFMKHRKSISELNLIDDFLFEESMANPKTAIPVAKMIIERATGIKVGTLSIECQKTIHGLDTEYHGIRLDVSISEVDIREEHAEIVRIYDIEPNNARTGDLPRRNRYYQALMDAKLLEPSVNYGKLPDLWSIWILPYDPFGGNRIIYTVKNIVEEMPGIEYNDGIRKIFLYTDGETGGDPGLKNMLRYIRHTSPKNAVDPELETLHSKIEQLKNNKELGVRYMMELERTIEKWKLMIEEAKKEARKLVTEEVTEEVTERVTEEVTERVTEEVTERVTEKVTERVTEEVTGRMIKSLIETCMELGVSKEHTTNRLIEKAGISPEAAQKYVQQYWAF